jgi:hypothetical protein
LRKLLDDPTADELLAANRALIKAIETGRPMTRRNARMSPNIFTRPNGGSARSARPRLTDAIMVDRTAAAAAEIATLRQKLAAAEARIREMGRHNTTEADKDNAFKLFTSWKSGKTKSTPTLDELRERMAALNCEIAKWSGSS